MQRQMLKSKIHRATVTDCDVDYIGSITIDTELMASADLITNEQVHVWDIDNGARFVTYVIDGEPGSGTMQVNGAAAHLTRPGHKIIVASFGAYDESDLERYSPVVVHVDDDNRAVAVDSHPEVLLADSQLRGRSHTAPPSPDRKPVSLPRLAEMKAAGEPIVMVTAYDYPSAKVAEEAGVDIVLVGDTAAMVVLGYPGTEPVSMDEMVDARQSRAPRPAHAADGRRHADGQLRGEQRAGGRRAPSGWSRRPAARWSSWRRAGPRSSGRGRSSAPGSR